MSGNRKKLRGRRFKVKSDRPIRLILQSVSGESLEGVVCDVSVRGISATLTSGSVEKFMLVIDQILPSGKMVADGIEVFLGRSVVKFIREGDEPKLGLMVIDTELPIEGKLAKFLDLNFQNIIESADSELGPEDVSLGDFLGKHWDHTDLFTRAKHYARFQASWKNTTRWGYFIPRRPSEGVRIRLGKPRTDGREDFIMMASNDYLGLASHPEVKEAAKQAIDRYGFGSTGSAVTVGNTEAHIELEEKLSRIFRTEAAFLFNSGYAANVGIISGLVNTEDMVIADILSHASIADGMMLSTGTKRFFRHNDVDHLEKILARYREEAAGALIVAEGVFSMDGDMAPLTEIKALAEKYYCRVMVDEAHSFGVIGPNGLGLCDSAGLLGGIDIIMGTFSKICGGIGGFVAGSREVIEWLKVVARSGFFSVSLPPANVAAASKALDVFLRTPSLRGDLRNNIDFFTEGLRRMGVSIPKDHCSSIIPVVIGDEQLMAKIYQILYDSGVFTIPVIFPAVSRNNCRFRFTVSALHTVSDLDYALLVLRRAFEKVGFDPAKVSLKAKQDVA